jgi:predicted P-loop ATPase
MREAGEFRAAALELSARPVVISAPEKTVSAGWKARLLKGTRGIFGNVANALTALRYSPEWQGVLHFNESSLAVTSKLKPPFERTPAVPFRWADEHDVQTAAWLQHQGISANKEIAGQAAQTVAREHSYHPIRDYLDAVEWDGMERIDDWLTLYLGADASDYARAVGACWLIGGVARIYKPGCKLDTCLILEGPQGSGKSTAVRTLAGEEFFGDDIAELGSKDSVLQTRGVWIIELAELDSMARGEVSRVKAFMSRQVDRVRPPYGRRVIEVPRECIFAGTVNHDTYLKDETGGRRFWPVKVGTVRLAELGRDRDQLWAEARARFRHGEKWWLDSRALIDAAAEEAQERYDSDPWEEEIGVWIGGRESVSVSEVLEMCLTKAKDSWTQGDQNRVARILRSRWWERFRARDGRRLNWRYRPTVKK